MRNNLAEDVLDKKMLFLMKVRMCVKETDVVVSYFKCSKYFLIPLQFSDFDRNNLSFAREPELMLAFHWPRTATYLRTDTRPTPFQ